MKIVVSTHKTEAAAKKAAAKHPDSEIIFQAETTRTHAAFLVVKDVQVTDNETNNGRR